MDAMFSIVIGRFQPPHEGHFQLFEEALARTKKLIILVGSTEIPRSIKNPFTFEERQEMIKGELRARGIKESQYVIISVTDAFYSDAVWLANVQAQVMTVTKGNNDILLVGHFKDDSSYYLKMFPQWKFHNVDSLAMGLSATEMRDNLFSGGEFNPGSVTDFLMEFKKRPEYKDLVEEYNYIREYKQSWEGTPYPVTFVTVDAVILRSGHVLMVRRGESPGKGNWALPGGFVNTNERLLDACIREVREETNMVLLSDILNERLVDTHVFDYPDRSLRGRTITHAHFFNLGMGVLPEVRSGSDASHVEWKTLNWVFGNMDKIHEDHGSIVSYFVTRNV